MTRNERQVNVLLTTKLGRVFPLFGVGEGSDGVLHCECGRRDCRRAGKHPRFRSYQKTATQNLDVILAWFERYPDANYGVIVGEKVICVDADVRPDDCKNGASELEQLEMDHGCRLDSVIVLTGSGSGSKHIYFRLPPSVPRNALSSRFHAVDLKKNGYCVTPGSRHVSGRYYRFETGCGPDERDVAIMPDFLLEKLFVPKPAGERQRVAVVPELFDQPCKSCAAVVPGRHRPDYVVEGQIRRHPVAGKLFAGHHQNRTKDGRYDRSRDDFRLCLYLAFYTAHDWKQYVRMFKKSKLYGEKDRPDYIKRTLERAFVSNPANWIDKPRKRKSRATGARRGRKLSPDTEAVIALHVQNPTARPVDIALQIGCSGAKVRNILSRYRNGFYRSCGGSVSQFCHAYTQGGCGFRSGVGQSTTVLLPVLAAEWFNLVECAKGALKYRGTARRPLHSSESRLRDCARSASAGHCLVPGTDSIARAAVASHNSVTLIHRGLWGWNWGSESA